MQRTYDFVLQPAATGQPLDVASIAAALVALGARLDEAGNGAWKVDRAEVTISLLKENGQPHGFDVRVPFVDDTRALEQVLKHLVDVAEALQLRIGDPQRGEFATLPALSSIIDEYLRMAKYAGEYGGVSEALGLSSYSSMPEDEGSSFRWLAILAVLAIAAYVGFRLVVRLNGDPEPELDTPAVYRP